MTNAGQANCERCGAPLAAATGELCPRCLLRAGVAGSAPTVRGEEVAPGFRVLEKIGEGGMGEVFLAEQTVPVHREVALKRLKAGLDTADWLRRFELEREALAQLEHPSIAKIFDAGVGPDGRPFYAMELIDGLPLTHFCSRNKLDSEARLRLFIVVCAAVQHAHQKGVLHGDLKPSNILVTVDEAGFAIPKLIDFGLARATWRQRFGTPGYASPEQMAGARPLDARSDVYSLGVVLRELLNGGKDPFCTEADWIVKRATAEVPEERYESAAALATDVRNLLACRPLAAGPNAWTYRARKFVRRERRGLIIVAITVVALATGNALLVRQSVQTREAKDQARAARMTSARDVLRRQITDRITTGMAAQGTGRYDEAQQHLFAARQMAKELGPEDESRRREVEYALARLYLVERRYRDAERVLKELIALPPLSPHGPENCEPLFDLTRLYVESRRFNDAEESAQRALELAEQQYPRRHPIFLKALYHTARVHTEQRRYMPAYEAFKEVVAGYRAHFGPEAPDTRQAIADLAEVEIVLRNMEILPAK